MLTRYNGNPVLSAQDVPYEAGLIFNAGVTRFNGKYVMVFRNDYGITPDDFKPYNCGRTKQAPRSKINLGIAFSENGLDWQVAEKPLTLMPEAEQVQEVYDPRLTVIDGRCYICFAVNTFYGVRGGIAVTDDFEKFEVLSLTVPDNRNMVLFPEKINGHFMRLERPFPVYSRTEAEAFDIWLSSSPDGYFWGKNKLLLGAEMVPFCNCKIGPGAPPVKTDAGWLTTFHAVEKFPDISFNSWHVGWNKRYYAGLMLLDADNPAKIIGIYNKPLLAPEQPYEKEGFRGEVIFPGGMILEDSGEVKIYYGAADTVECLAVSHIDDLLKLCGV
jgi:beta-1,4-mannooligosaccharide/beta-1,4-mannosyl-N-acetylglucosamine phosphorylase